MVGERAQESDACTHGVCRYSVPRRALHHFLTPGSKAKRWASSPWVGGWKSPRTPHPTVWRDTQICTALWRSYVLPGAIENNLNNHFPGLELLLELLCLFFCSPPHPPESAQQSQPAAPPSPKSFSKDMNICPGRLWFTSTGSLLCPCYFSLVLVGLQVDLRGSLLGNSIPSPFLPSLLNQLPCG